MARFAFLDPSATGFYPAWSNAADTSRCCTPKPAVRSYDRGLTDLVGELSTRSEAFRTGGPPTTCGRTVPASSTSSTPPSAGSTSPRRHGNPHRTRPDHDPVHCRTRHPSEENLKLLASWAATVDQAAAAHDGTSEHHLT